MYKSIVAIVVGAPFLWGACGASFPPPTQRMADAEAAERSARELGANSHPAAQLSLKLAQQQISQAKQAVSAGENERADSLLTRARADAELAVAQTREVIARKDSQEAVADANTQRATNVGQGAVK